MKRWWLQTAKPLLALGWWCLLAAPAAPQPALWEQHGCTGCHRFSPEAPAEGRKGPDLFFAGNKFQEPWLATWLKNPTVIRAAGYVTDPGFLTGQPEGAAPHPAVDAQTAQSLAAAMMQLTLLDFEPGIVPDEPLSKGQRFKFKILFERDYGCIACHRSVNLVGEPRGGVSGPSLLAAGRRLQADWVFHWLKTPRRFEPRGRMPVFQLSDETARALTRYVMDHRQETPP